MLNTQTIANTFIYLGYRDGVVITPMKLQKLVYILYKTCLKKTGDRLFLEGFSKWKYGPVVQSLYYEFSGFGSEPITRFARDAKGKIEIIDIKRKTKIQQLLMEVWEKYKLYTGIQLSDFTHQKGSAWDKAEIILKDEDIKNEREFI